MQQCRLFAALARQIVPARRAPLQVRMIRTGVAARNEKPAGEKAEEVGYIPPTLTPHRVSKYERYLLVWGGKYRTLDEVPALVRQDVMEKARNKARIKINIFLMFLTACGCAIMIYSGKLAHSRGESVQKMNIEWHRKINEEAAAERADAARKAAAALAAPK